jgi:seryl-tRNA synthetase
VPDYTVALADPVPERLADELARRVFFVAEEIEGFELVRADGHVAALRLRTWAPLVAEDLQRKIDRLVATDIRPQRNVHAREVWRSPHPERVEAAAFDAMVSHGMVAVSGEGQMAFGPPFTDLLDALDHWVQRLAVRVLGAEERSYPTLIPTEVLQRSGYMASFPQFLLLAARLHGDLDTYESFLAEIEAAPAAAVVTRHSTHAGYTLSPAVCYHAYQQLADTDLTVPLLSVTARGTCYRHESRYHRSLERLWEFTMREIVLVGDEGMVADARERIMAEVFRLVERLDLAGRCEASSDPFFCDARTAQRVWSQRALELKYELVLPVSDGGHVAAASFNVHGQTLGTAFAITTPAGDPVHTGCAAFGLERLAYAFVSHHGLDQASWPTLDDEGAD